MRFTKVFYMINALAIILLAGCGGVVNRVSDVGYVTQLEGNYVVLQSNKGDFIGKGKTYTYVPANSHINVKAIGRHLSITIIGDERWSGDFEVPDRLKQLHPGYYDDLKRYPFHNPVKGGLNWSGEGRGSNKLSGWFAIDAVTYHDGTIEAVDLRFEQHGENASPALYGRIHWKEMKNAN